MSKMPQATQTLGDILSVQPGEVVIGKVTHLDDTGTPWVDYPGNPTHQALTALTTIPLSKDNLEREVALLFSEGDLKKPVIMGLIRTDLDKVELSQPITTETSPLEARLDGHKVRLEAKQEIVLKCGKASITLTRAGKVIIRGAYLLSRSSGVNRIKGGSVQMN